MSHNELTSVLPLSEAIVREALTWTGVKWVDGGRSRLGIDCLGLIVMSARACNLDVKDHPELRNRPGMKSLVLAAGLYCNEIPVREMRRGTILLAHLEGEKDARHIMLFDGYAVIHCGMHWGRVVHHRLDEGLRRCVKRAWVFKEELQCQVIPAVQ
jgi:hypothetical protein